MATRVQSATSDSDPASATFGSTPVEGNLLVAIAMERSGGSAEDHTISGSGWEKRISTTTLQGDANARRTFSVWTKLAGASEPTNIQVDDGSANTKRLSMHEFELDVGEDEFTFLEKVEADTGTGTTSPLASGSTGSVSGDSFLILGIAIWRNSLGDLEPVAFTDGLTDQVLHWDGGGDSRAIAIAYKDDTAESTYDTEVSWNGADHEANIGLMVFRTSGGAGGGGGPTIGNQFKRSYRPRPFAPGNAR